MRLASINQEKKETTKKIIIYSNPDGRLRFCLESSKDYSGWRKRAEDGVG
jgi:hypothetical protein